MSHSSFCIFRALYESFSVSTLNTDRQELEKGGKIILPPSTLAYLSNCNIKFPILFKLINEQNKRISHAGVLEFIADEGKCYLPSWMMDNLFLEEGANVAVELVSLPIAEFSKFQAQSMNFLDITNPKAVLESALRNFACLTTGDIIAIKYNEIIYKLRVLETRPGTAVNIIECDMNVEFEEPLAPILPREPTTQNTVESVVVKENAFFGVGMRLDGKIKKKAKIETVEKKTNTSANAPDSDYQIGTITFNRSVLSSSVENSATNENESDPSGFIGLNYSLEEQSEEQL